MRLLIGLVPKSGQDFQTVGSQLAALRQRFPNITYVFEAEGDMNFVLMAEVNDSVQMTNLVRAVTAMNIGKKFVCIETKKL